MPFAESSVRGVAEKEGFDKRVLYYLGKSYTDQISRGNFYRKLKPAVFIGILNLVQTDNLYYISRSQVVAALLSVY